MATYDFRALSFDISAARDALEAPTRVREAFVWRNTEAGTEFWANYASGTLNTADNERARTILQDMIDTAQRMREGKTR